MPPVKSNKVMEVPDTNVVKGETTDKSKRTTFFNYLAKRLVPRFYRSWQGILSLTLIIFILIATYFFIRPFEFSSIKGLSSFDLEPPFYLSIEIVMGFVVFIVMLLRFHYDYRNATKQVETQATYIRNVEDEAKVQLEFPDFFQLKLRIIAERARLLMVKAESRANMLYGIGMTLIVVSAFAPFISIAIYINLEPLPETVVDSIQSLRNKGGDLPSGLSIVLAKDWRVLLSGISFGFLFLAAAGALFSQHRRQMETFFLLAKDVDYFDGVVSAAQIRSRSDEDSLTESMSKLVDDVLVKLLERQGRPEISESNLESSTARLNQLSELIKHLKS